MAVNNTVGAKLFAVYPGDEIFIVYNVYPYGQPKPIPINPKVGNMRLELKLVANRYDWGPLDHQYASEEDLNFTLKFDNALGSFYVP